ncbi:MAG: hypothetical protein QG589_250 [Patescibacteria group bacterium]|nr:hypothetical protein [Patescibacteria group bacterium]
MRYQVPQFIEIEDKVIGPLTVKQFVYLAGGGGLSFIAYNYLPFVIAILLIGVIVALSLALAFYKINNKPFIDFLESGFLYYTKDRLYIWKKEEKQPEHKEKEIVDAQVFVPRLSESKLKDLSWSLDVNENSNPVTRDNGNSDK